MSLSSNTPQEPVKFPPLTVSSIPSVPAPESRQKEPAPVPEPATEPDTQEAPAAEAEAAPAPVQEAPENQPPTEKKKVRWQGLALDTLLVTLVVAVLGGSSIYLKTQWDAYRVPTIMELAHAECLELCARREALQDDANHADEQLLMRKKLSHLDNQLRLLSEQATQLKASISDQQNRVLALQHEIRRADKEARSVARGLLPGLPIGDVTTTRGKTYTNATISRLMGKNLSLRTPYGAASFKINELVRDKLPDIVLYALGSIDLVDMSDFTSDGAVPSTPAVPNTKLRTATQARKDKSSYEPLPSAPIIDTSANKIQGGIDDSPLPPASRSYPAGDVWQPPTDDLPL